MSSPNIKHLLNNPIRFCGLGAKLMNVARPVSCSMRTKIKCAFTGEKVGGMGSCPTTEWMLDFDYKDKIPGNMTPGEYKEK